MRWLIAVALIVASASIVVPVILRHSDTSPDQLDQIHELAAF